MSEADLLARINEARRIAMPVGPMHALWDVIFDAEAYLNGNSTMLNYGPPNEALGNLIAALDDCLDLSRRSRTP